VAFADLDPGRAIPACREATERWPQEARFAFLYGRALEKRDAAEAVRWFRKAAEQGNADAQINLGLMYESGRGELVKD
jgi:TPR repeat protein